MWLQKHKRDFCTRALDKFISLTEMFDETNVEECRPSKTPPLGNEYLARVYNLFRLR